MMKPPHSLTTSRTAIQRDGMNLTKKIASLTGLLVALPAPLPALAQDADPANQLIEGYVACALGEGLPDKTVTTLGLYGSTHEEDTEMGVVTFQPGIGTDTFAFMSLTPGCCHVESTTLGTARARRHLRELAGRSVAGVGEITWARDDLHER